MGDIVNVVVLEGTVTSSSSISSAVGNVSLSETIALGKQSRTEPADSQLLLGSSNLIVPVQALLLNQSNTE